MNFSAVIFWTLGALAVGTAQGQLNESVDSPLTVEDRLQLLLDDHLIESADGLDFELHSPRQAERVLSFEQPWERPTADYVTVFKDGENNTDGISWGKPCLGLFEFEGSRDNNIVWRGATSHHFSPFIDTNPRAQPDERYKVIGASGSVGIYAFACSDAIHW